MATFRVTTDAGTFDMEFDGEPTPEQAQAALGAHLQGQDPNAAMGAFTTAQETAPMSGGDTSRALPLLGAAGGALLGGAATMSPAGAVLGGIQGYGLGNTAEAARQGDVSLPRALATGGASVLSMALPFTKALSIGKQILTQGLASSAGGAAYDYVTGNQAPDLAGTFTRGVEDFIPGAAGGALGEAANRTFTPVRPPRAGVLPESEQNFRQRFSAEQDIPLTASGKTGSRRAARIEKSGSISVGPISSEAYEATYQRQMQKVEESLQRNLDALGPGTDPATIKKVVPQVHQQITEAFGVGLQGVKRLFRPDASTEVEPLTLGQTIGQILDEQGDAPIPKTGAATRLRAATTQEPPPMPVLYDASGRQITLEQLATMKNLTLDKARFFISQLDNASPHSGTIGGVNPAVTKRLAGALSEDVDRMMANHPEANEVYQALKDAYGLTKDAFNERLARILDGDPGDRTVAALLPAGNTQAIRDLRNIMPREQFEALASARAQQWYREAVDPKTGVFSEDRFATQVAPYLKPDVKTKVAPIDEMFGPEQAQYFKDLRRFTPAIRSTEKLAGNPSRSGEFVGVGAQMLAGQQSLAALSRGDIPGAATYGAGVLAPAAIEAFTMSPAGQSFITGLANEGLSPMVARGTLGRPMTSQLATAGARPDLPDFARWLAAQGGL